MKKYKKHQKSNFFGGYFLITTFKIGTFRYLQFGGNYGKKELWAVVMVSHIKDLDI